MTKLRRSEKQAGRDGVASDPRTLALYLLDAGSDGRTAVDLASAKWQIAERVFTLDALAWALASTGKCREASALIDRALAEGTRWPPLSSRGGDCRRRRPFRRRRALGAQRRTRCASRCCLPSWGCSGRESCHTPGHEVSEMNKLRYVLRLIAVAGLPAIPLTHERRVTWTRRSSPWTMRRNTDRRLCVRLAEIRPAIPHDRSGGVPARRAGVGPNKYNFDDDVLYEIRVATEMTWRKDGRRTRYQFRFATSYRNRNTILQSYLG
jgi:hypothetical protein